MKSADGPPTVSLVKKHLMCWTPRGAHLLLQVRSRVLNDKRPTVEDVVRELYRCYGELGDRNGLSLADRRLREALRASLADPDDPGDDATLYEPQDETVSTFRQVLAELSARAAQEREPVDAGTTAAAAVAK